MRTVTEVGALCLLAATAWPQQKPALELTDVKGAVTGFGDDTARISYSIRVPKASELQKIGEVQDNYTRPFNSLVSWTVRIEKTRVSSLDAAVREATVPGILLKAEGSAVEGGFQVLRKPTDPVVAEAEVWTYKRGRKGGVRAQCSGPSKDLATLVEICGSLKLIE